MLTLALIIVAVLTGLTALVAKSNARTITLGGSIVNLALAIAAYIAYQNGQQHLLDFNIPWVPAFGINFHLAVDGVSLSLLLLTNLLIPFIVLSTYNHNYERSHVFYMLISAMQAGLLGVFAARDVFMFYVFYELALIPIFFICAWWGGLDRIRVTVKFFIYSLAGSLFMLLGILYLYFQTPDKTFSIDAFYQLSLTPIEQQWLFWCFFIAFAVKSPIFPFHTWQPATYTTAPAAGTMLLGGIMSKMGIYGLMRLVVPVMPIGVGMWQTWVIVLCVIGIVYGAIIAIRQDDMKTLLAYSSLSHMGLIAAGVLVMNPQGMQGAVVHMFNHGISVVALFTLVDVIEKRRGTRSIAQLGGLANESKWLSIVFMIALLGAVGLPLTNGFVGEFILLQAVFQWHPVAGAVAGLTIIFGAVYMFRMYRRVFYGEPEDGVLFNPPAWWEKTSAFVLCALVIVLGFYPAVLYTMSNASAAALLNFQQVVNSVSNTF